MALFLPPPPVNRRSGSDLETLSGGVAPVGFRKVDDDHPYVWLVTSELNALKLKEPGRTDFVRQLKSALGDRAKDWENEDTDPTDEPLGKYFTEVTTQERVALVAEPDKLYEFAVRAFEEAFTLAEAIDGTLARYRS